MEQMKYSDTAFAVSIDPAQVLCEVHANQVELPKRTVREHIEYALDHPIGAGPIEEAVQPGDKVCIIISDVTRRWQQPSAYLPVLVDRLNRAGIPDEDLLIRCATGTHRQQTEEEHIALVGEELCRRIKFRDHNCDDKEHLTFVGTSSRGTPVWLDSYAMACDKIILTGGIAYSDVICNDLKRRVGWIADFVLYPGEDELLALVQGGLRVMNGEEAAKEY